MTRKSTAVEFLRDLALRVGAAVTVVAIFVALGYVNRTDLFGLSSVLGNQGAFFAAAFALVGLVALGWVGIRQ